MYRYKNITFHRLGHDGFRLEYEGKNIVIDPFRLSEGLNIAGDYCCITHEHFDHLSLDDIARVVTSQTILIAPEICRDQLTSLINIKEKLFVQLGQQIFLDKFAVEVVPAYNTNKFKEPGVVFHPPGRGVGYIWTLGKTKVYHAGDTDVISEMHTIHPDVALLPVSGTYVMSAQECLDAIELLQSEVVIPMHFDSIVGTIHDAEFVAQHARCEVQVLEKE